VALVVLLVATSAGFWVLGDPGRRVTAHFTSAVGVYRGSDVRVLGVRVGEVVEVVPGPADVRVVLRLDGDVEVPADVNAAVVAPSVVSDRYVQLAPAYTGGERLAPGAVVPVSRTAGAVELDELYAGLDELLVALGPEGANADGSLSRLLDVGAATLDGNGETIGRTVDDLAEAARTLADTGDDLFGTVDGLQTFTTALARDDEQVGLAIDQLADVAEFFAAEREDLGAALTELATALGDVEAFVRDNRESLRTSVERLAPVAGRLAGQRAALAEVLDTVPLALHGLVRAADPATGTLTARANLPEYSNPAALPLPLVVGGR
jgi:virulence factor Mce-like protein